MDILFIKFDDKKRVYNNNTGGATNATAMMICVRNKKRLAVTVRVTGFLVGHGVAL